jgi:hypothetical protein
MAWDAKQKLVQEALKIVTKEHPEGFNKSQLIESSKKVNGEFSDIMIKGGYKPVRTHEDINNLANHMANIDGHYPVGLSDCFVVGINGDCGFRCPVFLDGNCKNMNDMTQKEIMDSEELDSQQKHDLIETYF